MVGPGRGSSASSLVSYCLGITDIDPIKYDLFFERFLNPQRVTMPDIDIDFSSLDREKIIDYAELNGDVDALEIADALQLDVFEVNEIMILLIKEGVLEEL